MPNNYLHERADFVDLLRILEQETSIQIQLIEKDYWIMHVLYGLKKQGLDFELKGGTSLSKGYKIIDRFSEDIDIHIKPPAHLGVNENPKNIKDKSVQSRKKFYDWLAGHIKMDGIVSIERDTAFDDESYYRSGGIRLRYEAKTGHVDGVKEGILLEAGFDTVTPNTQISISSWAYDKAIKTPNIAITDNRAINITCYHAGYTFVEKLQTIATKYIQEQNGADPRPNLMRQYYDVYCLLAHKEVQDFIGTPAYHEHKKIRFPKTDLEIPISENEAFLLNDKKIRDAFRKRYIGTASLYYKGQPDFEELLARINKYIGKL
ncbi:nucleotidyl transferase AbiEii/AbiGii toxin family protein [Flavivirga sp. 57AJ16]|uniref:nucleotidyl transferase AbiEii/AbiGii toxin family protein n=1 Tax=Flavivirga sp. 57AJ16 TaxID=3025307 RepID=UPI00236601ED|nr:nucleotidyl transferase AbiEii/AbiGii toxin family protein [Flavivirga sp. 57AJ16]MDD7886734.1 nucleotidyl transferase AbiEii/AbiGii toxin family protein [Flavivirga sp. 57AJ16]